MVFVILVVFVLLFPLPSSAQEAEGMIDLTDDVRAQIEIVRGRWLSGADQPAHRQVVLLQWLIELYDYVDDMDNVEVCYRQILAFFPYDVSTMNAYALFLFERRKDYDRAEKQLRDAAEWGKNTDARALDLGTTYQLMARVLQTKGNLDSSINYAKAALELLSEEASAGALRLLAESYLESGAYDDAADAYIKLITLDRALNHEDINTLQLFLHKTTKYNTGSVMDLIEAAVDEKKAMFRARIESEGGNVVSWPSDDGVVLEGTLRRAEGPGAVLFVTDLGRARSIYEPYEQLLFIDEITTMSVDLRGHGGSRTDSLLSYAELSPGNMERLTDDLVAGFRYLQKETGFSDDRIMIVAEGRGCVLAEKAMHQAALAAPVLYLSPYFRSRDLALKNAVAFHPEQPTLFVFSYEDIRAVESVEVFRSIKKLPSLKIKGLNDAGHGIDMLRRDTKALEFFQDWIGKTLGVR
jgi:tetratricopeptide (TPR) repeat protein